MCTVVVLRRPRHAWPLLLAANRDERLDRPWDAPGFWWPDRPRVVAGRDREAGGTWLAIGGSGVVAAVLNRPGSLGPAADKRSRGELPLLAADATDAHEAATRIVALPAAEWRPFNMVVADAHDAFFLRGVGAGQAIALPLEPGITLVTAHDPNDTGSPRIARYLPRFRAAGVPEPDRNDWADWAALLADDSIAQSAADALLVPPTDGFGTASSSLIALGADGARQWRFAPVLPGASPEYRSVDV